MDLADRILELLYDRSAGYFALEELASAAGAQRGGLDDALGELRRRWQQLEMSPSGVRLVRPVRLAARLIERNLGTRRIGRSVICFPEVDSTNDVALEAARQENADGLVVLAESQRRGRGRQGRPWLSPPGRNILLSALLIGPSRPAAPPHEALTVATGLAVAEAVEQTAGLLCHLRWPNDVQLDERKLAGVLVEIRRQGELRSVVLGVGLNVNAAPPAERVEGATCLADHVGHPVERIELVRSLLGRMDGWIDRIARGEWDRLHASFLSRCRMVNERVTVLCNGARHTGRVLDVDPLEGLVLCRDDGSRAHLPAARSTVVA